MYLYVALKWRHTAISPNCRGIRMSMLCSRNFYLLYLLRVCSLKTFYRFAIIQNTCNSGIKNLFTVNTSQQQSKMFRKSEAPAAERNKQPILYVLQQLIRIAGDGDFPVIKVLEIASGTGQHISHFAKHMNPKIFWQPTEFDTNSFSSICAYIQEYKLKNVAPPVYVDIREPFDKWNPICGGPESSVTDVKPITKFEEESFEYIYNSNLIHISSFECTEGLFYNSGKLLKRTGCLITYGPYGQNGIISPQSNIDFDANLRGVNPSWGVRDIQLQLTPLARKNNLHLVGVVSMPSNNKILVWQKVG